MRVHLRDPLHGGDHPDWTACGLFRGSGYEVTDDPELVTCGHCRKHVR